MDPGVSAAWFLLGSSSLLGAGEVGQALGLSLRLHCLVWKPTCEPGKEFKGVTWWLQNQGLELRNCHQREVMLKEHFLEMLRSHYLDLHLLRTGKGAVHLQSVPSFRQKELAGATRSTEGLR